VKIPVRAKVRMTKRLADGTEVVSTICDQCHATCGALAYVQNGRVVKLEVSFETLMP